METWAAGGVGRSCGTFSTAFPQHSPSLSPASLFCCRGFWLCRETTKEVVGTGCWPAQCPKLGAAVPWEAVHHGHWHPHGREPEEPALCHACGWLSAGGTKGQLSLLLLQVAQPRLRFQQVREDCRREGFSSLKQTEPSGMCQHGV